MSCKNNKRLELKCFKALYSLGLFSLWIPNLHSYKILSMTTYCYVFYYNIWKYGLMKWLFQSLKQMQMQMLNSRQEKMKGEETKLLERNFYLKKKCYFLFAGPHCFSWILNLILWKEAVVSLTIKTVCPLWTYRVLGGLFIILHFKL